MLDNPLVILAALVLLPLVPAFVLFRVLRSRGRVDGQMGSFKIALGGAFGGYFALTVFISTFYSQTLSKAGVEEWTVTGSFQFERGAEPPAIYCRLSPVLTLDPGNRFEWRIPVVKGTPLPRIAVEPSGYEGDTLYLSNETNALNPPDHKMLVDAKRRLIAFQPIKFKRTEPPPVQLAAAGNGGTP